jgi:site-specific DNA-cytosine methylase
MFLIFLFENWFLVCLHRTAQAESVPQCTDSGNASIEPPPPWKPPIDIAIEYWASRLPVKGVVGLMNFVRGNHGGPISTACSGSDIVMKFYESFHTYCLGNFGNTFDATQAFACEKDQSKQAFLMSTFPSTRSLFNTIAELSQPSAMNVVTQTRIVIPWSWINITGIPCTSRTRLNCHSKANKGCVERGDGATGSAFSEYIRYLKKITVPVVLLENVPALLDSNGSESLSDSDAQAVLDGLADVGYASKLFSIDCRDFGVPQSRPRIYILSFRLDSFPDAEYKLEEIADMLAHLKTKDHEKEAGPLYLEHFIMPRRLIDTLKAWPEQVPGRLGEPVQKNARNYNMQEYQEFYENADIDWPPRRGELQEFSDADKFLSERAYQCVYFCGRNFPQGRDTDDSVGFIDANQSLKVLVSVNVRNPWMSKPGTIVASTILVMRTRKIKVGDGVEPWLQWTYRVVCGLELMALQGWCYSSWDPEMPNLIPDHSLSTSLAGNSFNILACGPLIMCAYAALGANDKRRCANDKDEDVASSGEGPVSVDTDDDTDS